MLIGGMSARRSGKDGSRRLAIAGLLSLSFLMALGPLRRDLLPDLSHGNLLPADTIESAVLTLVTVVAAVLAGFRHCRWPRGAALLKCGLIGLGLFVSPALARALPEPVPALTSVALLALVTVFAAVLEPYLGGAETLPSEHALPSAIACVAGVFLIFPVEAPRTFLATAGWIATVAVAACIAGVNCVGVALLRGSADEETPRLAVAPALAVAAGTGAMAMALLAIFRGDAFQRSLQWSDIGWALFWPVFIDLPAIFLLFWLMRKMVATQMALRFVMGPLMAVIVEALALQQQLTAQTWAGLVIASAGLWWMLRSSAPSADLRDGALFTDES